MLKHLAPIPRFRIQSHSLAGESCNGRILSSFNKRVAFIDLSKAEKEKEKGVRLRSGLGAKSQF